jgi:hypothetical protein
MIMIENRSQQEGCNLPTCTNINRIFQIYVCGNAYIQNGVHGETGRKNKFLNRFLLFGLENLCISSANQTSVDQIMQTVLLTVFCVNVKCDFIL